MDRESQEWSEGVEGRWVLGCWAGQRGRLVGECADDIECSVANKVRRGDLHITHEV